MLSISHGVVELAAAYVGDDWPPQGYGYWSPPVGQQCEQIGDGNGSGAAERKPLAG